MEQEIKRPLRSYVTRFRGMSLASSADSARLYAKYGLDPRVKPDWEKVFPTNLGRKAITVEIGFGSGESVMHFAKEEPDVPVVGFEVYPIGVAALLRRLAKSELANVRVVQADAAELLPSWFKPGALGCVRMFFPDPWPKRRHHKRRLVNAKFVALLAELLTSDGVFLFKSDAENYVQEAYRLCVAHEHLQVERVRKCQLHADGLVTRFEQRARDLDKDVWQFCARRS